MSVPPEDDSHQLRARAQAAEAKLEEVEKALFFAGISLGGIPPTITHADGVRALKQKLDESNRERAALKEQLRNRA